MNATSLFPLRHHPETQLTPARNSLQKRIDFGTLGAIRNLNFLYERAYRYVQMHAISALEGARRRRMKHHVLERFAPLKEIPRPEQNKFTSPMRRIGFVIALCLTESALAAAQNPPGVPPRPDAQKCAALTELNLEAAPGGPAVITSAHLVEVSAGGLEPPFFHPSGYASSAAAKVASEIQRYCDVTGYVAPQNKFELKLPLLDGWNQKFFFYACGGFCGRVVGDACNLGLARGYASVTGNGGHESALGFDGIWAANAPELQEDFGWRSNHVVTLVAKTITTHYYGKPIKYSYMAGGSKGGQAVLAEAQKFPEDFDGLMPSAPVYDYTGRNTIAAAWFAQAVRGSA